MWRRLMIAGTVVTVLAGWAGTANAAMRWVIQQPAPVKGGSPLYGVSCTSPDSCTAVGVGGAGPVVQHWDGSTWAVQATPSAGTWLVSVSCASAASCTAVGFGRADTGYNATLIEHWDGSIWTIQTAPSPHGANSSQLAGVSCSSATSCVAVGWFTRAHSDELPLAEHWNGTKWNLQATPLPAGETAAAFSAVSCSSARSCTAVGSYSNLKDGVFQYTLAEHWDGRTWTVQATPNPGGGNGTSLSGVSCASAASCMAVGSYGDGSGATYTLAEHWDGSTWTVQPTPDPVGVRENGLSGVSCLDLTRCTAVGDTGPPLAEYWDGTSWVIQRTPNPAGSIDQTLSAVSCSLPTACTAVGLDFKNNWEALIEAR